MEQMLQKQADLPVLLMFRATDEPSLFTRAREAGASLTLLKPLKRRELVGFLSDGKSKRKMLRINGDVHETAQKPMPCTVLVAEDNTTNMLLAKTLLLKLLPRSRVLEAVNGKEAVTIFASSKPDLVFMDLHMPEMNGFEATASIRSTETGNPCPIIAMTADSPSEVTERCLEVGINDCIIKPYTQEILLQVLGKWLPGHSNKTTET